MIYAVVEIGGKQLWVESGKFYDVNQIDALPGETVYLNKVLLLRKKESIIIGNPCIQHYNITAKVLRHLKSKKVVVFKMKPKKNMRIKRGARQHLTRLLIEKI